MRNKRVLVSLESVFNWENQHLKETWANKCILNLRFPILLDVQTIKDIMWKSMKHSALWTSFNLIGWKNHTCSFHFIYFRRITLQQWSWFSRGHYIIELIGWIEIWKMHSYKIREIEYVKLPKVLNNTIHASFLVAMQTQHLWNKPKKTFDKNVCELKWKTIFIDELSPITHQRSTGLLSQLRTATVN